MLASLLERATTALPDPLREGWERTRSLHGPLAFSLGIVYRYGTVHELASLRDNLWLGLGLVQLVGCLVAELRLESDRPVPGWVRAVGGWWTWGVQSALGSMLGVVLVHFTRGARPGVAVLVAVGVLGVLGLNHFAPAHLAGSRTRLLLLWVCAYALALFSLPLLLGTLGIGVNLLAALFAMAVAALVVGAVEERGERLEELIRHGLGQGMLAVLFSVAGVLHWLPPVPLSLEEAAAVHDVGRAGDAWTLEWEGRRGPAGRVLVSEGPRPVAVYSRVFAPEGFELEVVHVWHHWDGGWTERDRIRYPMHGGRAGGYRGVTRKSAPEPGRWKVRIEDGQGRRLGAVQFRIVHGDPLLQRAHDGVDGASE